MAFTFKKPAAAPAPAPKAPKAPKAAAAAAPEEGGMHYRNLRKYTYPMLQALSEERGITDVATLIATLVEMESQKKHWPKRGEDDGVPKKRGRPSKADLEARAAAQAQAAIKPVANAAAVFSKAKAGAVVPPKPAAAAPKFAFKRPA